MKDNLKHSKKDQQNQEQVLEKAYNEWTSGGADEKKKVVTNNNVRNVEKDITTDPTEVSDF